MPNAVVMTGYGPPEVLKWAGVLLAEPGEGQIRIKVKVGASARPTWPCGPAIPQKALSLPPNAVLGFEAAGTVEAVGPGVTGTSIGDSVTALLFSLGGYAEYAVASIWTGKPDTVSWIDAAALPSSAEAAVGVLRQLDVKSGETLLLFGGGGSVGIIATQLAVARGVAVISAVGEHDETLARELLGATPVRYGAGVADRVRALGAVDAVFDAAGTGVLADAVALAGGPKRVITLSDPAAADFGVTLSEPTPDRAPGALDETVALLADGRRFACARTKPCPCSRPPRPTASWTAATSTSASSSPSASAGGTAAASPPLMARRRSHTEVRPVTPDAGAQRGGLSPADGSGPRELLRDRSAQGRWVIAAMILGSSVAGIDSTVVAVALPAIGRNLHVGFQDLQWTVTSYRPTAAKQATAPCRQCPFV